VEQWGLLFVMVGPAGVGKNALMNNVMSRIPNLQQLPTATTRAVRMGEQQGREHLFVNDAEFQHMIEANELLEYQVVHGHSYGVPRKTVEEALGDEIDLIADIDILGATALRTNYPDQAVLIFLRPPSVEDLRHRMVKRGENALEIEKRMQRVAMEMAFAPQCDYLITNDEVEKASEILYGIVLAERSRRELRKLRKNMDTPQSPVQREMMNELG
jgi:guanylate kinase